MMELSPVNFFSYKLQDDDELKSQFNQILNAIESIDANSAEAEQVMALNERIQREVTDKPILASIANDDSQFILWAACSLDNELFRPAIKFLILANPSALLWKTANGVRQIHRIARHSSQCILMPWIAANYHWVLDHEVCLANPPVFDLIRQYVHGSGNGTTRCTAAIIRQFSEAYPWGLSQPNARERFPLHVILMGSTECEPDLLKRMAEKGLSRMLETGSIGKTPLYYACRSLKSHLGDNSSAICKYLIAKCPESTRILSGSDTFPIHRLLSHCQHRVVKEVIVCLLRAYPESYNMVTSRYGAPSSVPFIQRIKPLLDEEVELKENVTYLQEMAGVFQDAVDGTQTPSSLASSTCDAFVNWATVSFVQRLEARMEQILTELQDECNAD